MKAVRRFAWLKTVGNTTSRGRVWLDAVEHAATTALRGGHVCCAQARQPVIMVGATASGPSCKKIGRKDLSCRERKARRVYARFRLAGYVRRRAGATCNHRGGATGGIPDISSCTTGERAKFYSFKRVPRVCVRFLLVLLVDL